MEHSCLASHCWLCFFVLTSYWSPGLSGFLGQSPYSVFLCFPQWAFLKHPCHALDSLINLKQVQTLWETVSSSQSCNSLPDSGAERQYDGIHFTLIGGRRTSSNQSNGCCGLHSVPDIFFFWLCHVACKIVCNQDKNLCPLQWEGDLSHWPMREAPDIF